MKNLLPDSLFCGIITLQLAVFSFVSGPKWSDCLSTTSLSNNWNNATVETGRPFPSFPVYDNKGQRKPLFESTERESAVIIKGTCSCDEGIVSNWLDTAQKKHLPATLVVPLDEKDEAKSFARRGWKCRVLRVRPMELERLRLLQVNGPKKLPIMAYVEADGMITGVRSSS